MNWFNSQCKFYEEAVDGANPQLSATLEQVGVIWCEGLNCLLQQLQSLFTTSSTINFMKERVISEGSINNNYKIVLSRNVWSAGRDDCLSASHVSPEVGRCGRLSDMFLTSRWYGELSSCVNSFVISRVDCCNSVLANTSWIVPFSMLRLVWQSASGHHDRRPRNAIIAR